MPRKPRVPSLRLHKPTGLAVVRFNGRDIYLGPHDSDEAHERYERLVGLWLANGRRLPDDADARRLERWPWTVTELCARFMEHADGYYRKADGSRTNEYDHFRTIVGLLVRKYGDTRAARFTPKRLKAVRSMMKRRGWSRRNINRNVVRVRSIFRWGVAEGLVPVRVHQALTTLAGLQKGRTDAPETPRRRAVDEATVEATLAHAGPVVAAMARLQLLTGMRPGEVCIMRPIDLDTSGPVWLYRPKEHKTAHHDHERIVALGPRAQAVVRPFLAGRGVEDYLFSPVEAEEARRAEAHARRKTPLSCGNRPGSNRATKRKRPPADRYTTGSYARAIQYACDKAFPAPLPLGRLDGETTRGWKTRLTDAEREALKAWRKAHRWTPNQLRKAAATRVRREAGLETARVVLGHTTSSVTEQFYAERDLSAAAAVMLKIG